MGAFGELLKKHFGGTRHDVSTCGKTATPQKSTHEKEAEEVETERIKFVDKLKNNTIRYGYSYGDKIDETWFRCIDGTYDEKSMKEFNEWYQRRKNLRT